MAVGRRLPQKGDLDRLRTNIFTARTPLDRVTAIQEGIRYLEQAQRQAVADARAQKESWGHIAEALGVSRSAAFERFRDVPDLDG